MHLENELAFIEHQMKMFRDDKKILEALDKMLDKCTTQLGMRLIDHYASKYMATSDKYVINIMNGFNRTLVEDIMGNKGWFDDLEIDTEDISIKCVEVLNNAMKQVLDILNDDDIYFEQKLKTLNLIPIKGNEHLFVECGDIDFNKYKYVIDDGNYSDVYSEEYLKSKSVKEIREKAVFGSNLYRHIKNSKGFDEQ